jgi:mycofactocin precursor
MPTSPVLRPTPSAPTGSPAVTPPTDEDAVGQSEAALVTEDLLVEDVSIDGMCGVY